MKTDTVFNFDCNNTPISTPTVDASMNSTLMESLETNNRSLHHTINTLLTRISVLENEIKELKNNTENSNIKNEYLCAQLRGQQKLTSYPGFSKQDKIIPPIDTSPHIILKIEEKNIDNEHNTFTELLEKELFNHGTNDESEEEEEETEDEEDEVEVEVEVVKEVVEEEEEVEEEEVEEEEVEDEVVKEEEEEEEEEEEVEEEDQEEVEESEEELHTDAEEEKEELEEEKEELEEEKEAEAEDAADDEEEVFEIEIDDITYFATDEENGILYAMTKDGDVGEKVGIIKEGEPIFS